MFYCVRDAIEEAVEMVKEIMVKYPENSMGDKYPFCSVVTGLAHDLYLTSSQGCTDLLR